MPTVIVTARNEADRLADTLRALKQVLPEERILVADDASTDATPHIALQEDAELVSAPRRLGKGGVANLAVDRLREAGPLPDLILCDGDLGASAGQLVRLSEAGDFVVAAFARRVGGGFGVALGFAAWAIRRLTGLEPEAPISGQRYLSAEAVAAVTPFAPGFGMEIGMTVDAHRAGLRLTEVELDLEHRATGRTAPGFVHRARQLRDFVRVYLSRR
ncbi:MAG TPA: glycosyltransferase [Thermoleophilaceae bacterium]|nr:glycosyltransferase [Thermoleophilaceae bacterium]